MSDIKLGDKVRDTITGYQGTLTSITENLHGCKRISIQAEVDHNGQVPDLEWFDEPRIEIANGKNTVGFLNTED